MVAMELPPVGYVAEFCSWNPSTLSITLKTLDNLYRAVQTMWRWTVRSWRAASGITSLMCTRGHCAAYVGLLEEVSSDMQLHLISLVCFSIHVLNY